jgi:hypothetical protein
MSSAPQIVEATLCFVATPRSHNNNRPAERRKSQAAARRPVAKLCSDHLFFPV